MISTAPPSFAQMAQEARKRAGMSLKQLSVAIGHDASFLSRLENGSRTPELPFVIRLATILALDPTTLLLAGVRDQLPEDLQGYVPNPAGAPGFDAARDHQAQLFEFELARLAVSAVVGANRFHVERTFE